MKALSDQKELTSSPGAEDDALEAPASRPGRWIRSPQ